MTINKRLEYAGIGKKRLLMGSIVDPKTKNEVDAHDVLYLEEFTEKELCFLDQWNRNIVILTKRKFPIESSVNNIPIIISLPKDTNVGIGQKVELCIDLTNYKIRNRNDYRIIYRNEDNIDSFEERLNDDIKNIEDKIGITHTQDFSVLYAGDQKELTMLSGQHATFAYQNKVIGLLYKQGMFRPDIHECTHFILYQYGNPPFLFLEGMATLMNEFLYSHNQNKSFDTLSRRYISKNQYFSLSDLMIINYDASDFHTHHYSIAASFVYYLIQVIKIEGVLTCYRSLSRKNSLQENLKIFAEVVGKPFYEIETEWRNRLAGKKE
jgi:hypothetical protein